MTLQSSPSTSAGQLLTPENQIVCAQLSGLNIAEVSQRAAALILLDQGTTQAEAADKSDLSIGQIRYLVKRFKEKGMEMFPAEVLAQAAGTGPGNEPVAEPARKAAPESAEKTAEEAPEAEHLTPEPPANDSPAEHVSEVAEKTPGNKTAKTRKKASKKRPKRPKPVKKKKSKRKRKKKKQG